MLAMKDQQAGFIDALHEWNYRRRVRHHLNQAANWNSHCDCSEVGDVDLDPPVQARSLDHPFKIPNLDQNLVDLSTGLPSPQVRNITLNFDEGSNMMLANLDQAAEELEKQEMQVQGGVAPPEVYAKLLAIYLLQNDLCNAKFLWKRIPPGVKAQNVEIGNIWAVGKAMWLRDAPGVYTTLSSTQWSDDVAPIMASLVDSSEASIQITKLYRSLIYKVRERCLGLVSQAYTSVTLDTLSKLLGVSPSEAATIALSNRWTVEDKLAYPVKPTPQQKQLTSTEQQLQILTNFVSFLEN